MPALYDDLPMVPYRDLAVRLPHPASAPSPCESMFSANVSSGGAVDVVLLQTGMERSSDQLVGAVFGQGEVEDARLVRERGCVELAFRGVDLQAADDDVHGLARAGTYANTRRYPRCFLKERNHRLNSYASLT